MKHLTRLIVPVVLCAIGALQASAAITLTGKSRWKPGDPTMQNVPLKWTAVDGADSYEVYMNGELAPNQPEGVATSQNEPMPLYSRDMKPELSMVPVFQVKALKNGKVIDTSNELQVFYQHFPTFDFMVTLCYMSNGSSSYTKNAHITWTAPANGIVKQYVIKRGEVGADGKVTNEVNYAYVKPDVLEFYDYKIGTSTKYSYRVNAQMTHTLCPEDYASNDNNYTYGVQPGTTKKSYTIKGVNKNERVIPVMETPDTYAGRNVAALYWSNTSTDKPTYYHVYRDNVLVSTIDANSTVDFAIPDNDEGEVYTYQVGAIYDDGSGDANANYKEYLSDPVTLGNSIELDVAKSRYGIEVVYNYPILDPDDSDYATHKAALGDNYIEGKGTLQNLKYALGIGGAPGDLVRKGVYRNGHWYLAQLTDDTTRDKVNANAPGGKAVDAEGHDDRGCHGNIYAVDANDPRKSINTASAVKKALLFQVPDRTNQSVGADDVTTLDGTKRLFYRNSTITNNSWTSYNSYKYFTGPLESICFKNTTGANPTTWQDKTKLTITPEISYPRTVTIDGSALTNQTYKQVGRVHYMSAHGRVHSDAATGGGDIILAPNRTLEARMLHLEEDKVVWQKTYTCPNDLLPAGFDLMETNNIENFAYFIPGREGWTKNPNSSTGANYTRSHFIHFIRNCGVFYVNGETGKYHKIYGPDNAKTAGGHVFHFDDYYFLINPTSATRNNTGHFRIDQGNRKDDGTAFAGWESFEYRKMTPAVSFVQDELTSFAAGNSNANWFGTEVDEKEGCVYIYQYVPGVRFAKYRFYKLNEFPRVEPNLDVVIAHDCEENPQKVTKFDAVMTWQRPEAYDFTPNTNYDIEYYKVELKNRYMQTLFSYNQPDDKYDGSKESIGAVYKLVWDGKYLYDEHGNQLFGAEHRYYNLDNQTYTLCVTPMYKHKSDGAMVVGDTGTDRGKTDYNTKLQNPRARAFKSGNIYRVDLDFDLDDNETKDNGTCWKYNEPADYYTIEMSTDGGSTWSHVPDMKVMYRTGTLVNIDGEDVWTTEIRHDEKLNGKQTVTNHVVPGCYKFKRLSSPTAPRVKVMGSTNTTEALQHSDKAFTNYAGDSKFLDMTDEDVVFPAVAYHVFESAAQPDFTQYKYRFTVHHAVDNSFVYRSDAVTATVENPGDRIVQTGVNDIVVDDNENAPVEYYNLQGMRLRGAPTPGQVVLRRQGTQVTKIIVK